MRTHTAEPEHQEAVSTEPGGEVRWAKVIDQDRCIGCHACTTACKSENEVPLSVTRTYVKYVDVGSFPRARRAFQVTRCNQCADAPCVTACPTSAMFARPDGIVDFDKSACIGCKACIAACPYDAIFINPEDHSAEKCNFCAHRLEMGLEPACVTVCPTEAILVGDLNDPSSKVSRIVHQEPVSVRRPEKDTRPTLFYRGAHLATLDPLAARRPEGGLFMWSEQGNGPGRVTSGHPGLEPGGQPAAPPGDHAAAQRSGLSNSSAAALLSYDVPHGLPWDWRVSLYTWTKSVASGAYLVPLLLAAFGLLSWMSPLWLFAAPLMGGLFLALTGALLIADLEHPVRFFYIFTRPQARSWLVRGAFVISAYAALLAAHLASVTLGTGVATRALAVVGLPLAAFVAVYTAWLFAQAKARDLWQSPLLPAHFFIQALLAGSGALVPVAVRVAPPAVEALLWMFAAASVIHLLLVGGEIGLPHVTAHARLAVHEMMRGRFALFFRAGVLLSTVGLLAPFVTMLGSAYVVICVGAGLLGLLAYEHAHVQAGQSVPLA